MIFTGPVDEYFDYRFGKLPYRSLEFKFETRNVRSRAAGAGHQLPERQRLHAGHRVQVPDRPGAPEDDAGLRVSAKAEGDPYYPVPRPENAALYQQVQELADATPGVHFVGRLGTYKYYNMDQVVAQALTLYSKIAGVPRRELRRRVHDATLAASRRAPLELWGGVECTVNRVGDRYFDQLERSGHDAPARRSRPLRRARHSRAALPGALGARRAAQPRPTPTGVDRRAARAAARSSASRRSSGWSTTAAARATRRSLDRDFPEKLARYARAVAERYPWVTRLHAGQRAADDRALQRPLRPLVSARARRSRRSCARC